MKLSIKLKDIDYADAAVMLVPLLADAPQGYPGAFGKRISALADLPESAIRDALSEIPAGEKAVLLSGFAAECADNFLQIINDELDRRQIGVTVADFAINEHLEATVRLEELDYPRLVSRFLPAVRKKLLNTGGAAALLRPMIEKASAEQICGLLNRFAGNNKDAFMASLINQNQRKLIAFMEKAAGKKHLRLKIESVYAEA